jgi:hypothetical protein
MSTRLVSSLGLSRGSCVMKTWMPDQVGHDSFQVVGHDSCQVVGRAHLSVIPAYAGIHAFKTWMPDQVGHDSSDTVGYAIQWGSA